MRGSKISAAAVEDLFLSLSLSLSLCLPHPSSSPSCVTALAHREEEEGGGRRKEEEEATNFTNGYRSKKLSRPLPPSLSCFYAPEGGGGGGGGGGRVGGGRERRRRKEGGRGEEVALRLLLQPLSTHIFFSLIYCQVL